MKWRKDRGTRAVRRITRKTVSQALGFSILSIGAAIGLFPLYWTWMISLRPDGWEFTYPPQWLPQYFLWENYLRAWRSGPFLIYTRNSLLVSILGTLGTVLTSSLSAYGFSRLRFAGRDLVFGLILSTMMLPSWVTIIPTFIIFKTLRWIDTLRPLYVPAWFGGGAFYIFLLRQFFLTLPVEMEEAARVDGASTFRIYWQIIMPLSGPALASVAVFSYINHWNDFMGPLIFTNSVHSRTLALGLRFFRNEYTTSVNLMMCAAIFMLIPVLILFFAAQRYFVRGVVMSGLAGR
jgi:multiple sugar transport system permease protein